MRRVLALTSVVVTVSACGGSGAPARFAVSDAWSRPTPANATNAVLYAVVESDQSDELVSVTVPGEIAGGAVLHAGDAGGSHAGHHGGTDTEMATMEQVESFPLDAGDAVTFEPGGNHVMLIDLAAPLVRDQRYTATFTFASGRSLDVEVVVADNPPA